MTDSDPGSDYQKMNLADDIEDARRRDPEGFRERLAAALHELLCDHIPEDGEGLTYQPEAGGKNLYQRRADTLIAWAAETATP